VSVRFLEVARDELLHAHHYYASCSAAAADRFRRDVRSALRRIMAHPDAWHLLDARFRRCQLTGFPYGVIYEKVGDDLIIVAVAHLHREPDYWRRHAP
jgi:plasmid stabilization system protein ParE